MTIERPKPIDIRVSIQYLVTTCAYRVTTMLERSSWFVCSAMDGVDEYMPAIDVPRRMLSTPRRQLPIRSMIEGDDLEFRWQNEVSVYLHRK